MGRAWLLSWMGLAAWAVASYPASARADETGSAADPARARAYFLPARPLGFFSLSAGGGGFGAGSAEGPNKTFYGYGGARGTLAMRADLEALSPLWLSVTGRTFGITPAEAEVDASVGYEFRSWSSNATGTLHTRIQWRPLVGLKTLRFADSATAPTSARETAVRAGLDWTVNGDQAIRGFNVWRAHVVGLWDAARAEPGVEVETTAGMAFPRTLGGGFLGCTLGYLPSAGGFFILEIGATWEVGTTR